MAYKPVQSLIRGLQLIEAVSRQHGGVGLKELAAAAGCSSAATYHLIQTLAEAGFVQRLESPPRYILGGKLMQLANYEKICNFFDAVYDEMKAIHRLLPGSDVYFSQAMAGNLMIRTQILEHSREQLQYEVNQSLPAYVSASSVVHLAYWASEERDKYVSRYEYSSYGQFFWGPWEKFDAVLAQTRKDSYFLMPVEDARHLKIGFPVFNSGQTFAAAVTIQWTQQSKVGLAAKRKKLKEIAVNSGKKIALELAQTEKS